MTQPAPSKPGDVAGWPKLVVSYATEPAGIAELLPPGLEPGEPTVDMAFYCVPVLGEPEYGVSIKVPAAWRGVDGHYCLGIGIDQEAAVHISAETNGQPKFLCEVDFFRLGDGVRARASHQGYTFAEYSGRVVGEARTEPDGSTEHEWWTKYSRAIGGAKGEFDFPPHVVDVETSFEPARVEDVEGSLVLRDSPWDPVARYLPVRAVRSARLVTRQPTARSITNAGPLDPDAFWPFADVIGGSRWPGERGGPRAS